MFLEAHSLPGVNHHSFAGEAGPPTVSHLLKPGRDRSEAGGPETPTSGGPHGDPQSATTNSARAEWGFRVARSPIPPKDTGNPAF